MYFDSHVHLDDKCFDTDRHELIKGLKEREISYVVNIGADMDSSGMSVNLADQYDFIYAAVGVHPHEAASMKNQDLDDLAKMCRHPKVRAIGEIGLDYHYDFSPRDVQKRCFEDQIELAYQLDLPVIIHDREAHQDILNILRANRDKLRGGVVHCFSGSWEMAKAVMDLGFFISLGGTVTFKNSKRPVEIARNIPLDRLLIETDCPYLAPDPHRGKRNDPGYVIYVARKIAEIREMTPEEIGRVTTDNAKRFFGIL